jgi:16S rRNA (guanine966-N2)-methyltransferase
VFLDPPYRKALVPAALASLAEGNWLVSGTVLVAETAEDEALPVSEVFQVLDDRVYGDTRVSFLRVAK